jgi:adenylate cyclase
MTTSEFEYEGFEEARAIARRRRRRILLPLAIVLIMLLALTGIAIHNYRAMRADTLTLSEGVIKNLQSRIETELQAYIGSMTRIIELSHDLLTGDLQDGLPKARVEPYLIGIMSHAGGLTAIFAGTKDGAFLMVRRYKDAEHEGLETKLIRRSTGGANGLEIELTRRDSAGRAISREILPWDQYDPRTRPWYQGADESRTVYWTDVYPFFTDLSAGVTASVPVVSADDTLRGVIGADVKLETISEFLKSLKIGKTGQALIIDDRGRLIAHPTAEMVREDADGQRRLATIEDLGDPIIQRAFDRYRIERHGSRHFELDGRRYISSVSSLSQQVQRDWSVMVVVPEDDYVGFVADNVRQTLIMGLSVVALASILAALVIRQGLRTDRDALRILEREAQLDAEGEAFGKLASGQTALFDSQTPDALQPVTEAAGQAARVRRVSIWRLDADNATLTCLDCFDRDTGGHTQGSRLTRAEHPELFNALEDKTVFRAIDVTADPRLSSLHHHYLGPLGCRSLVGVPIRVADRVAGALWLEDTGRRLEWPEHTLSFAKAVANLLAISSARQAPIGPPFGAAGQIPSAKVKDDDGRHPEVEVAFRQHDLDTSLVDRRAAAFTARLAAGAEASGGSGAEMIERLAVMSLRLTDAMVLAEPAEPDNRETTVAQLLHELQTAAVEYRIGYLKFFSDQVIASVDPNEDTESSLERLTEFALRVRTICESLFARHQAPLAFRIGIDIGPAVGSLVGAEKRSFAFWGEAVQAAGIMADTSLPGAIQVTETVYDELRERYLFQLRGHHYLEQVGEFSTYLLGSRL